MRTDVEGRNSGVYATRGQCSVFCEILSILLRRRWEVVHCVLNNSDVYLKINK